MAKKKVYNPIGAQSATYGWAGIDSVGFAERMKLASIRFRALKKELKFDAIAFCVSSGCAVAFSLAAKHKIPLIYVRKTYEKSHSNTKVECNDKSVEVKKYLIVDDFIDTGGTMDYIVYSITKYAKAANAYPAEPVGVLCFDPYVDRDRDIETDIVSFKMFSVDTKVCTRTDKAKEEFLAGRW
jgi:adenine/guanine phosphoribosyltransferase-like PRPP-binding protein